MSTKKKQADSRSNNFDMKREMKIGIWDVRTLRETGKLRQAVACMRNYGLSILGMSEVRRKEFGEMTTHDVATFIYSGRPQDDNTSREGMGKLMDKEAKRSLIEWHPVSARIVVAGFKKTIINIVMIQCYEATAAAEEAERQEFYVQLNEIIKMQKKRDNIILGGDLNEKWARKMKGMSILWADMV
jgi:exonuclease III